MLKRCGHSIFCDWSYWICICRSYPFRRRRILEWITQWDFLKFALVKLLVSAPLFNTPKTILHLKCLQLLLLEESHRGQGRRRGFFPHVLFICNARRIIWTYHLPSYVIFNLLPEIKDDFKPSSRSHTKPALFNILWLLYSLFVTTLVCAVLGMLHWLINKWDVAELCSRTNLPCLVKLALSVYEWIKHGPSQVLQHQLQPVLGG